MVNRDLDMEIINRSYNYFENKFINKNKVLLSYSCILFLCMFVCFKLKIVLRGLIIPLIYQKISVSLREEWCTPIRKRRCFLSQVVVSSDLLLRKVLLLVSNMNVYEINHVSTCSVLALKGKRTKDGNFVLNVPFSQLQGAL